jgi:hypothetical protein
MPQCTSSTTIIKKRKNEIMESWIWIIGGFEEEYRKQNNYKRSNYCRYHRGIIFIEGKTSVYGYALEMPHSGISLTIHTSFYCKQKAHGLQASVFKKKNVTLKTIKFKSASVF